MVRPLGEDACPALARILPVRVIRTPWRSLSMRHVLVTGGAGFIGSHVVGSLLRDGHRVTVLDNFDPFYPRAVKERNIDGHRRCPAWRLVEGDVRDLAGLRRHLTDDYDAVLHVAAKAGVRPSIDDPAGYQDVNVRGTQNLLEFARERGVRQFVFASSSSVYGVNRRVPWTEEDSVLRPISPYAGTKVAGELLGHVYAHLYGIRFISLRFFTVYGPGQRPDLAIHKFTRLILDGRPVPVFGDGSTSRDYTFIDDIVSGVRAALEYHGTNYEVINLGNNRTVTLIEMIRGIEEALGLSATLVRLPEQPGDVPQTWASIEKARVLLGYSPGTSYAEGVPRFVKWLCAEQGRTNAGCSPRAAAERTVDEAGSHVAR
jgi:UDP-glucuronate 4-epimerase